jgi:dihydroflavonol-4-reductase
MERFVKAFVTGATGHIGINLVRRLVINGHDVRAFVRPKSPRDLLNQYPVEEAVGDLLDADSLRTAMRGCDVVFHAGAVYSLWDPDPDAIICPTVEGSRNVLRTAATCGVRRVVYVSTMGTVGFTTDPNRPLDETSFNSHSRMPYLRAKIEAERHALEYASQTGLPVVFVLPGFVYGAYFTRITPSVQFVLDYLVKGAGVYFEMGISVVDAEDVAQGAIRAAERGHAGERYLLGGENMTFRRFYATLSAITGLPGPGVRVPNWTLAPLAFALESRARVTRNAPLLTRDMVHDFRGRYAFVSSEKARRELGYLPLDADEVLRRTVEWLLHLGWVPATRRRRMTQWNRTPKDNA